VWLVSHQCGSLAQVTDLCGHTRCHTLNMRPVERKIPNVLVKLLLNPHRQEAPSLAIPGEGITNQCQRRESFFATTGGIQGGHKWKYASGWFSSVGVYPRREAD